MENAKDIKEWCEEQWRGRLLNGGYRNVFVQGPGGIQTKAGSQPTYKSKEQKAYEARFAIYNKKLVPIILAEATQTVENVECAVLNEYGRPVKNGNVTETEVKRLPVYRWPAVVKTAAVESIPRKRVSHKKVAQAAAILERVPADELTAFLARFGLSLSLAASIASLDNVEQIARQFLRATL